MSIKKSTDRLYFEQWRKVGVKVMSLSGNQNKNADLKGAIQERLGDQYRLPSDIYESGKTNSNCEYGVCSIRGCGTSRDMMTNRAKKKNQEDTTAVDGGDFVKTLINLPAEQQRAAMVSAFEKSHREVNSVASGSCATVVAANLQNGNLTAMVGYLGDSPAYSIIVRANKSVEVTPLNPEFHDGNNKREVAAITQDGPDNEKLRAETKRVKGEMIEGRLQTVYGLAVTRAVGDQCYDDLGVSHVAQVNPVTTQKLNSGDRAFILVGSDGIMEHCKGEKAVQQFNQDLQATLTNLLTIDPSASSEKISEAVVYQALLKGSKDNISAVVTEVKGPVLSAVYDGHGGKDNVSTFLRDHHFANIKEAVQQLVEKNAAEQKAQKVSTQAATMFSHAKKEVPKASEQRDARRMVDFDSMQEARPNPLTKKFTAKKSFEKERMTENELDVVKKDVQSAQAVLQEVKGELQVAQNKLDELRRKSPFTDLKNNPDYNSEYKKARVITDKIASKTSKLPSLLQNYIKRNGKYQYEANKLVGKLKEEVKALQKGGTLSLESMVELQHLWNKMQNGSGSKLKSFFTRISEKRLFNYLNDIESLKSLNTSKLQGVNSDFTASILLAEDEVKKCQDKVNIQEGILKALTARVDNAKVDNQDRRTTLSGSSAAMFHSGKTSKGRIEDQQVESKRSSLPKNK